MTSITCLRKFHSLPLVILFLLTVSPIGMTQDGNGVLSLLNEKHPAVLPLNAGIAPEICCWFIMGGEDYQKDDYKIWLDQMTRYGSFELLSASPRQPPEIVDPVFHDWIKRAANYAYDQHGVRLIFDLDIRLARQAFAQQYPDAQQERLIFLEIPIPPQGTLELPFQVAAFNDHYTGGMTPYLVLGNRFLKSWTYTKNDDGEIVPSSLRVVTQETTVASENNERAVLRWDSKQSSGFFCGAVAFRYLYPDVFSSEIAGFQKKIIRQYHDVPLAGACQDEWGFLPSDWNGNPAKNEYWYSNCMAEMYAKQYNGSSLLDDCFLMFRGRAGEEDRRREKIDAFNRLCLDRHAWYAAEFYKMVKEVFGSQGVIATHPTWWPWPDQREFKKNGLVWWKTPRDYAQTDECTPYYCRTSLAKGTDSVWYNMYYAPLESINEYVGEHWGGALAGGRVNIHPVYPSPSGTKPEARLRLTQVFDHGMAAARHRIRLLDWITHAPLDSPVAVVFGHFGAMNWGRSEFDKVGSTAIQCCDCLAEAGYPADLTPSSQAASGLWSLDSEGFLKYGVQKYTLVVFFGESDSDRADFEKLRKLCSEGGKTKIVDMAATIDRESLQKTSEELVRSLREQGIQPQTPWKIAFPWGKDFPTARPPLTGRGRYVDGTHIWVAAEKNPAGDEILLTKTPISEKPGAPTVSVSATGLFACRFDTDGKLSALAASELKHFEGGGVALHPESSVDVALRRNADGSWSGVLQAAENRLPKGLDVLPKTQWKFLALPLESK